MADPDNSLAQSELDDLLRIHGLLAEGEKNGVALIDELENAILDSGKLSLAQWRALRDKLKAIERLIPHRRPLIMVDRVRGFELGERPTLWASRNISSNEPVFDGHFPGLHLWPGIYTQEGLGQSARFGNWFPGTSIVRTFRPQLVDSIDDQVMVDDFLRRVRQAARLG